MNPPGLLTPWVRDQLIEYLGRLSDRAWQKENWTSREAADDGLDEMLDFFDDSGVLGDPCGSSCRCFGPRNPAHPIARGT
ncbi:hypothetical protein P8A18_13190 [Streptomyces castrisilvae]|uniref:Transposase n=1 Tax=Streptomyces castrisilvae TaxID=3033811 RepID=A0ABY9HIH7_9ACTN|nr:hypothetical protein [Streptomyces sp. Mut1]WLQ34335.1 hypothetical protein P8A18_13190 [Streptomyces sp. Mut1]